MDDADLPMTEKEAQELSATLYAATTLYLEGQFEDAYDIVGEVMDPRTLLYLFGLWAETIALLAPLIGEGNVVTPQELVERMAVGNAMFEAKDRPAGSGQ